MRRLAIALLMLVISLPARAADWPTYRKDMRRSGVTSEQLTMPLAQAWVFKARFAPSPAFGHGYPKSTNWEGGVEKRRIDFDRADAVVVAGTKAYFGSVGDGKVYCLDTTSGKVLWTYRTDGPVRLAPTITGGKAYFGSDDGHVYCVDAATGTLTWKFRAAPDDHKIIGNGHLISLWPVRTGVLVAPSTSSGQAKGVAYFSAGIFPSEGVFSYALDAASGRVLWKNDREGEKRLTQVAPQGYQLATEDVLVVPMSRMAPAVYDRAGGDLLYKLYIYYGGGTFGTMYKSFLFSGWGSAHCFPIGKKHPGKANYGTSAHVANFPGGKLVYADGMVYSCAIPKNQGASTSVQAFAWRPESGASDADKRRGKAKLPAPVKTWTVKFPMAESIILGGKTLYVGGKGVVKALNAADGKTLWSQNVPGLVLHLALGGGRLYASTDKGNIHCFAPAGVKVIGEVSEATDRDVKVSPAARAAAERVVALAPDRKKGFALVYGVETGELALELVRRTELKIVAISPDAKKVAAARALLDTAGVYGGRAVVIQQSLEKVPFTKYFANLVVSETAMLTGASVGSAAEMVRMCTPARGTVIQSDRKSGGDTWAVFKRPALPGAAGWTDQYGTAAACGTSEDDLVRAPLRVQWFGEPGGEHMVDRHYSGSAPLAADGRLFVQTRKGINAYDAYNGTQLWFYPLANAAHPNMGLCAGNAVIAPEGYFIASDETLRRMDPETGEVLQQYTVPPHPDGKRRTWGYLAVVDGIIIGSRTIGYMPVPKWTARGGDVGPVACSDILFGMDAKTGKVLWTYKTTWFYAFTPAIGNKTVYIGYAQGAGGADLARAVGEKTRYLKTFSAAAQAKLAKSGPWTMLLAGLDIKTGQPRWKRIVDVSVCGGARATLAYKNGRLFHFSGTGGDKSFDGLIRGRWAHRVIVARNALTGDLLWMKNYDYRGRVAFIGDTALAEPFLLDAATGERKMVENPVTGAKTPWFMIRPYKNCGPFNVSKHTMFFRNDSIGYYDIGRNEGSATFDSHRPSCWMSFNSANGLATFAAGGSACRCPGALQGTVVLVHDDDNRVFGDFAIHDRNVLPVKHLFVNFGAPGDRRDEAKQLWLGHPRRKFKGGFQLPIAATFYEDGDFGRRDSTWNTIANTPVPWVHNSWAAGLKSLTMTVRRKADGAGKYTVTLLLAAPAGDVEGRRVFDVKVQGKVVAKGVDVVKRAGGADKAVTLPIAGVAAGETIAIELVSPHAAPTQAQWPILCGVTVVAE